MIYPSDFEDKIGFTTLRNLLTEKCQSNKGKDCVAKMRFSTSYAFINTSLHQTSELMHALSQGTDIPATSVPDISESAATLKAEGSFIAADKMLRLRIFLQSTAEIQKFCCKNSDESTPMYPYLAALFVDMPLFPQLVHEIDAVINKFGEVKETASPELYDIVRKINSLSSSMSGIVRRIMSKAVQDGIIDKDTAPAMRDGRIVIPIPATHKRAVNGIVHDMSATGKTSFIEPAEVVEAGNRLRELEMERHREEAVILTRLSGVIRPHLEQIEQAVRLGGLFDFIMAKAIVADICHAQMPVLERKLEFEWYHAVHPTLQLTLEEQGRSVVPFNLRLDRKNRFLVISGPNAGGKSVTLKTVGIIQYMTQCGMLPTLHDNSHIGITDSIFIDIGDQQSIENDLSTYSSHLRNMKHFMKNATRNSLILIDEIGSGTEPQIGSALAQAILGTIGKTGAYGVVTTHYQNIKTFADNEEGFVNGAMLYDRQLFKPLFQLSVGHPGSSFAIEIARSIGLPAEVIDQAKDLVGSDYINMEKYLLDIARDRRYWANKRLSIKEKEQKIDSTLSDFETRANDLKSSRSTIIKEAREEARKILEGTNAIIERTIHDIRKVQAEREQTKKIRRELEDYKKQIESIEAAEKTPEILRLPVRKKSKPASAKSSNTLTVKKEFAPGDYVKMQDGGVTGQIISVNGKKAEVAFGQLRTIVSVNKLTSSVKPKTAAATQTSSITRSTSDDIRDRQLRFRQDLDVRGLRGDEALQAVTYFIDDAIQFSAARVRILHGTGTGALRSVIRQWLQANAAVTSFHDEDVRLGGAGITVIELDT